MTATQNQLNFDSAMNDFSLMFPTFDRLTIERVLRANNGLVDATIDQLLAMCVAERDSRDATDGSIQERSSIAVDIVRSSQVPQQEPTVREERLVDIDDQTDAPPPVNSLNAASNSPEEVITPAQRFFLSNNLVRWNPPLLGPLPDDFLRFEDPSQSPASSSPPTPSRTSHQTQAASTSKQRHAPDSPLVSHDSTRHLMETRHPHNHSFQASFDNDRERRFVSSRSQQNQQSGAGSLESPSSPDSLALHLRRHSGDIPSGMMTAYLHEMPADAFVCPFSSTIFKNVYFNNLLYLR